MDVLLWLIPAAVFLGFVGLIAFLWALKSGQFDDLDGAAHRILFDDPNDTPLPPQETVHAPKASANSKTRGEEKKQALK
ncbi:MAG: cbb3-type cytochrome oxidase assembly protein CcoS [Defluviicoccus sp.]|nr:cbb3-type cytochrome oxidase assembly protein CcoS [Defluviicoccus sp.]MDG4592734.1 cbb3-type cytochrome oxidase assembly protein CcoS [Defluviicoccus sp.]MDS4012073.1 cbb3-type cytochrome oxidase assembly protein CcoS [Defluviicoccus sp.]MDS4074029.1 cbb3-type cytochrome oxidase assembly protein CcoS [Defluviicoccus sp.]